MPNKFLNLQLFGEEGGDMAGSDMGSSMDVANPGAENVSEGGVATTEGTEQVATAEESWNDMIKGRYKKEYDAAVQKAVNKRFKNQQNLQSQIDSIDPIVRQLASRYGVQPNADGSIPIDQLSAKLNEDDSMYEQEAFQRGMSVQDLKQLKALENENRMLKANNQRTAEQQEWDAIVSQGDATREVYPDFDLDVELQNPQFGRLLATMQKSGFPNAVQTAYEAVHRDEIMGGAMRYAVAQTEQKISNSIQSGMRRPSENGTRQQSSSTIGNMDPSKLTRDQIAEIKRRAERGERVIF